MLRLSEKIRDLLHPEPNCGCWLYTGERCSRNDYGRVRWDGREQQIHRVVWKIIKGPIPPGLILDHCCRVRWCAYPDHLEPVTVRINTRRGDAVLFR